jgi:quercetin dioxygenase-like cupin family protein
MAEVTSKNSARVPADKMKMKGAKGVSMRLLLADKDKVPNFAMRLFEIRPKGHTPYHTHDSEHEVFVLSGRGYVKSIKAKTTFETGSAVYVPPGVKHNFVNTGEDTLKFLCIVPLDPKPLARKKPAGK